ncbi:uncharacterized protein LOC123556599 [Mercenaria mercenaria]|uniref:uncharacterized protein LOC123556599 n=1 Tax=Mercenaria mercenaria TaxID=6596 RepID=UPI00234E93D7|nr:uncharacterized protein LOC123556599 [Mercenaria mercenaria]
MSEDVNYCGPCLRVAENNIAVIYCLECSQSLCENCKKFHQRLESLSGHKLYNLGDDKNDTDKLDFLKSLTKCPEHQSEEVRYICKDHDQLCCNECAIVKHRKCDHIVSLSDEISTQGTTGPETKKRLDKIEQNAGKLIKLEKEQDSNVQASIAQVEEKLVKMKNVIDEAFLKMKQAIKCEVTEKTGNIRKQNKMQIERIETLTSEIDKSRRKLDIVRENGENVHLFLVGRKLMTELTKHEEMLQKLQKESSVKNFNLVENIKEQDLVNSITSCFHIEEKAYSELKDLEPALVYEVKTLLSTGNSHSCIWIDNYLVVAKQNSNQIHLFDVVDKAIKYNKTKTSSSNHWSAAKIDNSKFVLCFPQTKTIEIMKIIEGVFKTEKSIETCNDIWDVTFDKLSSEMICLSRSGAIDCYKLDGTKSRSLSLTPVVMGAVKNAYSICVDSDRQVLYISSHTLNKLLAVKLDGATVFEYNSPKLTAPWYLDLDRDGIIYLPFWYLDGGKGAVHQIDDTGKLIREIKLPGHGASVCFDRTGTKFVISCSASEYLVLMYDFK